MITDAQMLEHCSKFACSECPIRRDCNVYKALFGEESGR